VCACAWLCSLWRDVRVSRVSSEPFCLSWSLRLWACVLQRGKLLGTVTCTVCHAVSRKEDPFETLSLEIAGMRSVHDALRHFTAIEWLDGREMYRCEGACGKTLVCAATRCSRCCPRALSTTAAHVRLRHVRRFAPRRCCRSTCRRSCS
jgi:hypothetical protein